MGNVTPIDIIVDSELAQEVFSKACKKVRLSVSDQPKLKELFRFRTQNIPPDLIIIGMSEGKGEGLINTYQFDHNNFDAIFKKYPNAIFVLDIEKKEAERISQEYGVICVSNAKDFGNLLKDVPPTRLLYAPFEEKKDGWNDFIKESKPAPSNAMLICDKYLFKRCFKIQSGEVVPQVTLEDRLTFLVNLLATFVVSTKSELHDYPVSIFFEASQFVDGNAKSDKISCCFERVRKQLEAKIKESLPQIQIQLVGLEKNKEKNKEKKTNILEMKMHDRRVITTYNYFSASVELFKFNSGQVVMSHHRLSSLNEHDQLNVPRQIADFVYAYDSIKDSKLKLLVGYINSDEGSFDQRLFKGTGNYWVEVEVKDEAGKDNNNVKIFLGEDNNNVKYRIQNNRNKPLDIGMKIKVRKNLIQEDYNREGYLHVYYHMYDILPECIEK